MTANLPVWYLQGGAMNAEGKFAPCSQASAVLVATRKKGENAARKLLLTVQHAMRSGSDKRSGPYHPEFRTWPPGVGYDAAQGIPVTIFPELTPKAATTLAEPEDLAFLELPPDKTGSPAAILLEDSLCQPDLAELEIAGYISGENLIKNHANIVKAAIHPEWRFVSMLPASAVGILGPGKGQPAEGVSGGGIFHAERLVGLYRGAFIGTGQHLFLPVKRLREWCELHGYELVSVGANATPSRDELTPSSQTINAQQISQTLWTLARLMQNPDIREAAIVFDSDFKLAKEQIGLLVDYKQLHDGLHTLQISLYDQIVIEMMYFPDDQQAIYDLQIHLQALDELLYDLQKVAARRRIREEETAWIKQVLVPSRDAMNHALLARDKEKLSDAARAINRLLATRPSMINTSLCNAAKALRLPKLLEDLEKLGEDMARLGKENRHFLQFREGITNLSALSTRLDALITRHNLWQGVDNELRWLASSMKGEIATEDIEEAWPALVKDVETLCNCEPDPCTVQCQTIAVALGSALQKGIGIHIQKEFGKFLTQARKVFFRLDRSLREQCDELPALGDPLNAVLRMMQ
jgi:hypothetical protein